MAQTSHSQLAPLPTNLPFDLISETLGRGAYAFVRKGRDHGSGAVCAVKFIHKQYSEKYGHITPKQLLLEVALHQHVGHHRNVIQFYASEENDTWRWIAMEFADGGDLFDKIEADVGVQGDIAHFYFHQLLAGTEFIHSKGVAHRDIKPENILLDSNGNLKIADFGFASLYKHKGKVKTSTQLVGSPPYVAPEVSQGVGYVGDQVDIWSCGVVLFVLLTGNTPWDEPTDRSAEFYEYKSTGGKATYEPWNLISDDVLSLIRGMMTVNPSKRYTADDIKKHPWYTAPNPLMTSNGTCRDGLALATRLVEGLHVDFTQNDPRTLVASTPEDPDVMDYDDNQGGSGDTTHHRVSSASTEVIPSTQALSDDMGSLSLDWADENPELNCSQQPSQYLRSKAPAPPQQPAQDFVSAGYSYNDDQILASISEDPVQSQFAAQPAVSMTLTQAARRFNDICPAGRMTRFYTIWPYSRFLPLLLSALRKAGVPVDGRSYDSKVSELRMQGQTAYVKVKTRDGRKCVLAGSVGIERVTSGGGEGLFVVNWDKAKGDPVEWRRLFKRVSVLCQEAVFRGRGLG
ncbi:Chk1 protein kinase [Orbilia brochopaga]|uniref:Chk1 protein kinase n=2 Tax=Orbilia brochopaga TaxID=3140254 RepID=A0AAV9UB38_9PEZI